MDLCIKIPHHEHINNVLAEAREEALQGSRLAVAMKEKLDRLAGVSAATPAGSETDADLIAVVARADYVESCCRASNRSCYEARIALSTAIKRHKQLERWRKSEVQTMRRGYHFFLPRSIAAEVAAEVAAAAAAGAAAGAVEEGAVEEGTISAERWIIDEAAAVAATARAKPIAAGSASHAQSIKSRMIPFHVHKELQTTKGNACSGLECL